ncbi:Beta-galactosidase BoGH2A [Microbacterium oxydans]|uniref:glycoside hydrolase family 2 TIM barrel-domain containing protein n=1 Tax=Microbacterium oxydans TaxID=82380 RepID=UPI001D669A61|nr:glycoside hydrolase family 2 TIM barrel-domain containing protein [Microbacterium oxydans]CAH0191888.1 Beta-galactosidase BoGH2A [Microbacterium oxydans]
MSTTSFADGWIVRDKLSIFAQLRAGAGGDRAITLPHDAIIGSARNPSGEAAQAFYDGGTFEYVKKFDVPAEWRQKRVALHFHGVYRDAMIFVNEAFVAQRPSGYSEFFIELDAYLEYGTANTIRVETRANSDSRWYTGSGIYRDVDLIVTSPVHIAPRGVVVTTPDVDDERAVVETAVNVRNAGRSTVTREIAVRLTAPDGTLAARSSAPVTVRPGETVVARLRSYIDAPVRWSIDNPNLYSADVTLGTADELDDEHRLRIGVRTLQLDPARGLRINGETVALRGTCVHHDNGILGAASFSRAEERKVTQLKNAGFNAVRAAHSPFAESFLDACDRLGVLVMDEAFDVWADSKSPLDSSLAFPEWWERDIEAMVRKDRNHASVILYSIGNEILEVGNPHGAAMGRALSEKIRDIDPTRFITNGINAMVSVMPAVLAMREQAGAEPTGGVNAVMASQPNMMTQVVTSKAVGDATAESFAVLDVAGWNYADSRYVQDLAEYPDRIVVGTETFPNAIASNWALVKDHSHVIGDFTWTGMDYLGEVGVGRQQYADETYSFEASFPWITAWCGDLDITGFRRPASYYREIVFGLREAPYLAVHRPENHDREAVRGRWSWSDSIASWTWDVEPGSPIRVEVYADAEEIELLLEGESLGRIEPGADLPFLALFDVHFRPGELTAVAYRGGIEIGRTSLRTASEPRLAARVDRETVSTSHGELIFVELELRDAAGVLHTAADVEVVVSIDGPGELLAVGSARPATTERYDTGRHTLFDGRALAVVRPVTTGSIRISAVAEGLGEASVVVTVEAPAAS